MPVTFKLKTGATLELPTEESVVAAIKGMEAELKRLRRLKNVVVDLNNGGDEDEDEDDKS